MNKADKLTMIAELKEEFSKAKAAFFADYKGLTVEQANDLRRKLRAQNVKLKVVKNNLARRAVKEAGLGAESEALLETVVGPTVVAFAYGDPAAAAKVIQKFSEEIDVFTLKDSILEAQRLSAKQIEELSKLPGREVLIAKMLGSMNSPITSMVGVLAAVPRNFVQVLSAYAEKKKSQA